MPEQPSRLERHHHRKTPELPRDPLRCEAGRQKRALAGPFVLLADSTFTGETNETVNFGKDRTHEHRAGSVV